jgi:hypothetical protein
MYANNAAPNFECFASGEPAGRPDGLVICGVRFLGRDRDVACRRQNPEFVEIQCWRQSTTPTNADERSLDWATFAFLLHLAPDHFLALNSRMFIAFTILGVRGKILSKSRIKKFHRFSRTWCGQSARRTSSGSPGEAEPLVSLETLRNRRSAVFKGYQSVSLANLEKPSR